MVDTEAQAKMDRTIMVTLSIFLFAQTSGAIWWAASISKDVTAVSLAVVQIRADAYSRVEAALQIQNRDQRIDTLKVQVSEQEARIRDVEKFLGKAFSK